MTNIITPTKHRRHLSELNIWLTQIEQLEQASADPHATSQRGTANPERLPFGLANRIDNPADGPQGVRTAQGARDIIQSWANHLADVHPANNRQTYPITYPIGYLHTHADWAYENFLDYQAMTEEIQQLRNWAAHLTGHADQTIGTCPHCENPITTTPTENGLPEHGTCTGCDRWYANHKDITRERERVAREKISRISDPTVFLPVDAVLTAHPDLLPDTLKKWVKRGHVPRNSNGYQIAAVNLRMGTISTTLSP